MIIELHMLQNFVPANLNRDDTGSPKDCLFGGHRRARISSQCLKRAIRNDFKDSHLLDASHFSSRTKRLVEAVTQNLVVRHNRQKEDAEQVVIALLNNAKLKVVKDNKTEYLLFLSQEEIASITQLCLDNWDVVLDAVRDIQQEAARAAVAENQEEQKKQKKQKPAANLPSGLDEQLIKCLNGGRAADLALFGRMIADIAERNVDGASQVAHAISTNKVEMEFDFYTAVDDLKPEDTAGADMLGTIEFNSACFYRYANVDLTQLTKNLGGDAGLAQRTLEAFLRASINAIPTGKQNSMAAHNPPSLVLAVVRGSGQWNLANAFIKPVRPQQHSDLMDESITALDDYWNKLATMYGASDLLCRVATTEPQHLKHLAAGVRPSVEQVIQEVLAAVRPAQS